MYPLTTQFTSRLYVREEYTFLLALVNLFYAFLKMSVNLGLSFLGTTCADHLPFKSDLSNVVANHFYDGIWLCWLIAKFL